MKRFLALLLVLSMVFALCGCGGANSIAEETSNAPEAAQSAPVHTHTEEKIEGKEPTCTESGLSDGVRCSECGEILTEQEVLPALGHTDTGWTCERCGLSLGNWKLDYYCDEFKQPTDLWFIRNSQYYFEGTFSNSATDNSLLLTLFSVDYDERVGIYLYEYGKNLVKKSYDNDYSIVMRTSDGVDHDMKGSIYGGGNCVVVHEKYTPAILEALMGTDDIMFFIQDIDHPTTKYLFTVQPSNFAEIYSDIHDGQ